MRFKEMIGNSGSSAPIAARMGGTRFAPNIFRTDERTPHWEMRESIEIIETRPQVASALKQIVRFIMNNSIEFVSDDKKTKEFLNNWLDLRRRHIKNELENFMFITTAVGNGYTESRRKPVSDKNVFDNIYALPDPSRLWINLDHKEDESDYWVYEVPFMVKSYRGKSPKYFKLNYVKGIQLLTNSIWGIPFHKNHFKHLKLGWSRDGLYGRGFISSTIDDHNILREILKNLAVIARYRALNTKLIRPAGEDMELIEDDIIAIEEKLLNKREEEHLIINKALTIESLSNTNEYDTMGSEIDYLRKDIGSGLVPSFITPWTGDSSYSNAAEAKLPFQLELEYLSEVFIDFFNEVIIDELRKDYSFISKDATIRFGKIDLQTFEEKANYASAMYGSGVITFNEFREVMGYDPVPNGDAYNWQLEAEPDSMFMDTNTSSKKQAEPMTASIKEKHFVTQKNKKPSKRICSNCRYFMPKKRFCNLNNWPAEEKDSCDRFSYKDTDEQ